MNSLHFGGEWAPLFSLSAALVLATAAFLLYRRETRALPQTSAHFLPLLRAGAVLLLVLMLSGPVLKHRRTLGTLTRLLVLADCSQSMGITDEDMDLSRKVALARRLGWLPPAPQDPATECADLLQTAIESLEKVLRLTGQTNAEWVEAIESYLDLTGRALALAPKIGLKDESTALERQGRALLDRYRPLLRRSDLPVRQFLSDFPQAAEVARRFRQAALAKARTILNEEAGGEQKLSAALARLDKTPRTERVRTLLFEGGEESLLASLAPRFDVQLASLDGPLSRTLWTSKDGFEKMPTTLPAPEAPSTDLVSVLLQRVGSSLKAKPGADKERSDDSEQRTAVLLFTDGQHNASGSPIELAKNLGDRGIPLYCVGYGSHVPPNDLSVVNVEAPETVYFEDRVRGTVSLKDDMTPGLEYQLRVLCNGKPVWEKNLLTSRRRLFQLPFDFAIKDLVKELQNEAGAAIQRSAIPLHFEASITPLPNERETRNNTSRFLVRASTAKRKLLILDGRPRWDTLYIRNVFNRDPRWQVNTLLADNDKGLNPWPRGDQPGMFPDSEQKLREYDAVVLGDLPRPFLSDTELQWIADFVAKRGGGLLVLDGQRQFLPAYAQTGSSPLAPLLPVAFSSNPNATAETAPPKSLEPTERGRLFGALQLDPGTGDSSALWRTLPAPRWISGATPLPGAETLLLAQTERGAVPALVLRRFGAGQVAYLAFEETWRWRNNVADKFQGRFWNQLIPAVSEPMFAVQDNAVALDTDAFSYRPGASAQDRARIRSAAEGANTRREWRAVLTREGKRVATLPLSPEEGRPDLFLGQSAPLEAGSYSLSLEGASSGSANPGVTVSFEVASRSEGELADLTLNENLLGRMASESKGLFLREENTDKLREALTPLETGRIVETETALWQSYWWFSAVLLLLTLEWLLRKRIGLL